MRAYYSYQDFSNDGELGTNAAQLLVANSETPIADPVAYLMPVSASTLGVCVGMGENLGGQNLQTVYSRAWRPFLDFCVSHNSAGSDGYSGLLGLAGSLTGEDHLSVQLQNSGSQGPGSPVTRSFGHPLSALLLGATIVNRIKTALLGLAALWLVACSTSIQSTASYEKLDEQAKWVLLPLANNTSTPQAGFGRGYVGSSVAHGITSLVSYPSALSRDTLFEPTERKVSDEAQKWAREQGARFAVTGSVEEWRYKVGIDGEPAVGVTLKVIDLSNSRVVWSASGAKSGWSREALSAVAQALLTDLLKSLQTAPVKSAS